jgi:hypothetical protein
MADPQQTAPQTGTSVAAATPPTFNPRELMNLYVAGRYDELSDAFLGLLGHFEKAIYATLSRQAQYFVNAFVKNFLYLFTQSDYIISERHVLPFLRQNLTISNIVSVSAFRTTDAWLELLRDQEANFVKILTLYSARNSLKLERRKLFDADPARASTWYSAYCQIYRTGLISELVCQNLREHYEYRDDRLNLTYEPQEAYFGSTYVDGECDRLVKPAVNRSLRQLASQYAVRNTPDPRKIAVFSALWAPNHSVYRITSQYVAALRDKYHLTFYQLAGFGLDIDKSQFNEVRHIDSSSGKIDITSVINNDFQVAFFPDVGMSPHSIVLANMRLAPIQIASLGHSVSTWGADIDYFISGVHAEVPENPERNYSERLVLLPDSGAIHNRPLYEPVGRKKTVPEFVINCPWFSQKVNYRFCHVLQRIMDESGKALRLRLYVGTSLMRQSDFLSFFRQIGSVLRKAQIEIVANRPYPDYMGLMEEGDLSIDSFHFGGCNTIADSLYLRIPTVTWEGDKWYSRIGSQMLRMVGLGELVATTDDEYVRLVGRLIADDEYRQQIHGRLVAADLDATIFNGRTATCFREAVDYLIANHERLKRDTDRRAIRYDRDIRK